MPLNKMQAKIAEAIVKVLHDNGIHYYTLLAQDPDHPDGLIHLYNYPNIFWARGLYENMSDAAKMEFLLRNGYGEKKEGGQ